MGLRSFSRPLADERLTVLSVVTGVVEASVVLTGLADAYKGESNAERFARVSATLAGLTSKLMPNSKQLNDVTRRNNI